MSDIIFGSKIESLVGGTADTFVVCVGAGQAVAQKTVAQVKTLLNLSGTNTGDQTSVSGNAGSATVLQTARTINGVSFDGSANITVTAAGSTLSDTVPVGKGGTGLTALGSALQVLRVNAGATALEYATASGGIGGSTGATDRAILIANGTGGSTMQASGATVSAGSVVACQGVAVKMAGTTPGADFHLVGSFGMTATPAGSQILGFSATGAITGSANVGHSLNGGLIVKTSGVTVLDAGYSAQTVSAIAYNASSVPLKAKGTTSQSADVFRTETVGGATEVAIAPGGKISTIAGISPGVVTYAVLNATTATVGLGMYRVSDRSNKYAYPDGTNWRWFNDGAIIS